MRLFSVFQCLGVLIAGTIFMANANARTIVYVSHADSKEIYVLELNPTDGTSALVEKVPVSGTAMPMAITPDHKFLFVSLRSEPYSVSSFAIDPQTGKL